MEAELMAQRLTVAKESAEQRAAHEMASQSETATERCMLSVV
jgi:hypothetical protein